MRRILVVDDDKSIHRLFCRILGKRFKIDYAEDGFDASEMVRRKNYNIIFLDMIMPRGLGLDFLKLVKKLKHKMPPVVIMTGFKADELIEESLSLGADCCLHKPFERDELISIINKIISQKDTQKNEKTYKGLLST